eukprot:Lankesteria_metandrocarpae@DN2120_c0_g1_i2.p1
MSKKKCRPKRPHGKILIILREIPERLLFNAFVLERRLTALDKWRRRAFSLLTCCTKSLPFFHNILCSSWLWVLAENEDIYERRFAVLTDEPAVLLYKSNSVFSPVVEVLKICRTSLMELSGIYETQCIEIKSTFRLRNIVVCIAFPSVTTKVKWLFSMLAVLSHLSPETKSWCDFYRQFLHLRFEPELLNEMPKTCPAA